jgi:DNA mismatch repair protein MutL
MAEIKVLDPGTAELIAAGEVVERPASVVKELTENAIDAGSSSITVSIARGGVSMIQITDNGSGIEPEYIPTAFLRHATSKLRTAEDLESLHTLGFRGEALASIASVARVELLTRTEEAEFASLYRISGGKEEGMEAAARPVGTTITVRDLFFNVPARMKFLKKDTSEGNVAADVVGQLALSHPEISFKFVREGKVQFQTPGDGRLLGAAYAVLSREFARDLVKVDDAREGYCVQGLVTPPKSGRASRSMQFFFINGRFVKNRTMMAALETAYKGVLMQGKFPGCVLSLQMPPHLVDVNVHPAKTEVRFAREKDVFDAVYGAVKSVLLTPKSTEKELLFSQAQPALQDDGAEDFAQEKANESEKSANVYTPPQSEPSAARASHVTAYTEPLRPSAQQIRAWNQTVHTLASQPVVPYVLNAKQAAEVIAEMAAEAEATPQSAAVRSLDDATPVGDACGRAEMPLAEEFAPEQTMLTGAEQTQPLRFVGEVFDTYIVAQRNRDVCFIDKHAAHERMIYESLMASYGHVSSQMLLMPVTVLLSGDEKSALMQNELMLRDSGLEVEDFGGNSVVVRAVPADVTPDDVEDLVVELASHLCENPRYTTGEKTEWVLHSIACRAAIKAGDKTHCMQLLKLAQEVLDGNIPPFCPHGRPIVLKLTEKELEKQFGRQG